MKAQNILAIILATFSTCQIYSQNQTVVRGKVTDKEKQGIQYVRVSNLNSRDKTLTDANGNFSIEADKGDSLKFSFIGFLSRKVPVEDSNCDVILEEDSLNDVLPQKVNITEKTDNEEYEAIVIEPGFETFLATQHPREFYSEQTLKTKNIFMVNEWNYRHANPLQYNPQIYEEAIDYNPNISYGLEVEYTLYMFFRYMDKKHGTKLERR